MQRGATFPCQIESTESRRPVGLFTNLAWVKSQMLPGWPRLHKVDRQLHYDGLLPARCSCSTPHAPMRGTDGQEASNSSIAAGFSKKCWFSTCPSPCVSKSPCVSPFSFSGWSASAFFLYDVWACGLLSRSFLADYAGVSSAAEFFGPWKYGDCSRFCSITSSGPVFGAAQLAGTGPDVVRSSSSTQASGPSKAPLVTLSSRWLRWTKRGPSWEVDKF